MKQLLTKLFGPSWETSLAGYGTLICGGTAAGNMVFEYLPDQYTPILAAICTLLTAYGFIRGKDGNVTNSQNPGKAAPIVETSSGLVVRNVTASCLALLVVGLVGCNAAQIQKTQDVLVKLKADAQTVAVVGCANAPVAELLLDTALELLPPGTTIDQIHAGMQLAQPQIAAFCARLQQLQAPQAPVSQPVPAGAPGLS